MVPADTSYHRAESWAHAATLLREQPGSMILAGGQSLIPLMKLRLARPSALIDITRIPGLDDISVHDGMLRIGAGVTVAQLLSSPMVERASGLLAETAAVIADPLVRNLGTVGGNIAHADPLNDLPAALVACRGRVITFGPEGERTLEADALFVGPFATAVGEYELITRIEIPTSRHGAYEKFKRAAVDYGVVAVAVHLELDTGRIQAVGIAATGAQSVAARAATAENILLGASATQTDIDQAARSMTADIEVVDDERGSVRYKAALIEVLAQRALKRAIGGHQEQYA